MAGTGAAGTGRPSDSLFNVSKHIRMYLFFGAQPSEDVVTAVPVDSKKLVRVVVRITFTDNNYNNNNNNILLSIVI